jgi:preprotein translocase subunit YajC
MLLLLLQDAAPGGFAIGGLLFPLLILVVFYLFLIRPQQTREKKRQQMITELSKGDRIITAGGIHGTVIKVDDSSLLVEVDQNTKLRFEKNAVTGTAG